MSDISVDDPYLTRIPAGEYEVTYLRHETRFVHSKKLIVTFVIVDGEYSGLTVPRYYNVQDFLGNVGEGGKFRVGRKSHFYREYLSLFDPDSVRPDRMAMSRFKDEYLWAQVRVVAHAGGIELPQAAQYSVIDRLIAVS